MKKIMMYTVLSVVTTFIWARTSISGTADIMADANIKDSGGYATLLNPGNAYGIKDAAISSNLVVKLDSGDERSSFSAWFSLKEYPIGRGLLMASYDNDTQQFLVNDFSEYYGETIYSFELMQLNAVINISDNLYLEAGRQSMMTGYGYGWNPVDFADSRKDPSDPEAELLGVDSISLKGFFGSTVSFNIYALSPSSGLGGLNYEDILPGGEITLSFPGLELLFSGIWDYDSVDGSDCYTPAAGSAFKLDVLGAGLYGEASLRKGSRNYFIDGSSPGRKSSMLWSGLLGVEYTFSSELSIITEYFYNGEGLNSSERDDFRTYISSQPSESSEILNMYIPGYFSKQYLLLNLMQPLYEINTAVSVSALYSIDSGALMVMPEISMDLSGNLSAALVYTGLFSLIKEEFNDIDEIPVKHTVRFKITYNF